MLALGSLAFASPWLLAALAALPALWWLLRVTPPAPRRVVFPAIRLLLGLTPREETPARTPWWLILLRTAIAGLVIVALAHPLLNPQPLLAGRGPLVLVIDDGWAAAHDWSRRQAAALRVLAEARREGRHVVLVTTAPLASDQPAPPLGPIRAADARAAVQALQPKPWPDDRKTALARLQRMPVAQGSTSVWISDDVADGGGKALADYLDGRGTLRYLAAAPDAAPRLLLAGAAPGALAGRDLGVVVRSLPAAAPRRLAVRASDENGALLARRTATLAPDATSVAVSLPMPNELRNRLARIAIEGEQSAGAVLLVDERWRRRPVGIAAPRNPEGQPLLSGNYYLERALSPFTEVRRGPALDLLKRRLAVLIYAGSGPNSAAEAARVRQWVERGGLLLRFAGPEMAVQGDHLLPVRLRRGGRTIGGALSWEKPARLAPFDRSSPFFGLTVPPDVTVSRQVLAEPDLDLAGNTWARLADGTPLVTAGKRGKGWIVLVHTTAGPEWSNLALSGLYVEMLRRIVGMSQGVETAGEGTLAPLATLDGFGRLERAPPVAQPIAARAIAAAIPSPRHPPGFYGLSDARRALNLSGAVTEVKPIAALPAGIAREGLLRKSAEIDIRPPLLTAAFLLALLDLLIGYALRGLLRRRPAGIAAGLALALLLPTAAARADDAFVIRATSAVRLAFVETGDGKVDAISRAGLAGLTDVLNQRTAVETGSPMGIDIESDELILFPLIYWPVTPDQPPPSPQAAARINRYLETGGTILFDTRNAGEVTPGPFGEAGASASALRRLARGVKIPPLVPMPPNHVLTKSFYLLQEFPGRWTGQVWIEPTRDHVNDGVASVIVGGNDWAGAWAIDAEGRPEFACVPGGERQREMARRFGVNLVMYVLTGNYKNDQVHVPAILERLGQ
jgi:Domain of unknown function (DUF4159)/Aerotolerance regulator N-terminal